MLSAPIGEQRVARPARSLLDSTCWLVCRPGENFVPDSPRRKPAVQKADFGAALRPQPMIHRQRTDLSLPLARPAIRQNGEGKTVGATGDSDGEKRAGLERASEAREAANSARVSGSVGGACGQQPSLFFSSFARSLIVFPGFGKSRSSCASAVHAFCFWFDTGERHAELQQIVCCLRPFRIAFVTLGKRDCCFGVVSAHVICFAEPVLSAPGQPVVRMLSDEALQGCFGSRIVCLLQQTEGEDYIARKLNRLATRPKKADGWHRRLLRSPARA